MIDPKNISFIISSLGWSKVAYLVSITLLLRHVVNFQECLLLLLVATLLDRGSTNRAKSPSKSSQPSGKNIEIKNQHHPTDDD